MSASLHKQTYEKQISKWNQFFFDFLKHFLVLDHIGDLLVSR